jgi:cytochrome c-type biogenesis protein CcmF
MNTNYIGEQLGPGQLGHFFIILTFVASLFSAFCYIRAAMTERTSEADSRSWLLLARNSFIVHTFAIFGIFFALYYIITNHLFEYHYAWAHSSKSLPPKYLLSCFWEGQEGSFMLWAFWHSLLGLVVMKTAKGLESRVMTVVALVQVTLASMLLGFYLSPEFKIGSTPFLLLRHQMSNAPIFSDPNYLANFIQDGNGLNVLLQNYWMVIHPPVLFLGFASTLIPFAYAIAALWKGDYKEWVKPAINWSLWTGGVLGLGIMMGGAWAYESLTFGGYWAWDPVENASLVPWLTLVAGLHTLVVYRNTGRNFIITMVFLLLTYVLIWYSTFLTRTGVLGDTSVHAFTGEGKSLYWHLIVVLAGLIISCIIMLARRWKSLPRVQTEEAASSREFWMFIGSFVLLLSAAHIILVTSIPVWAPLAKWISGKDIAPPVERELHYNSIQIWVAIVVALLSAAVLFLKFKATDVRAFWKRFAIVLALSIGLTVFIGIAQKIEGAQYLLLLFAGSFGLVANMFYAFAVQSGSLKKRGAAFTHFGFAMILVGILISSYNKEVISFNTTGTISDFGKKTAAENIKESRENVMMFNGLPMAMGNYNATYLGDSTSPDDPRVFYKVLFERKKKDGSKESFLLYPDAFVNPKGQEGLSANPASKHYLNRDIFTYVNSVPDKRKQVDTVSYKQHTVHRGDSIFLNNGYLVFNGFDRDVKNPNYSPLSGDIAVAAKLSVYTLQGSVQELRPVFIIRGNEMAQVDDTAKALQAYTRFANVLPQEDAAVIEVKQADMKDDWIVLKVLVFPWINLLWLGILVMVLGFMLSLTNRATQKEKIQLDVMKGTRKR